MNKKVLRPASIFVLTLAALWPTSNAVAADTISVFDYKSTVSSDANGLLDLTAELNYDTSVTNAPIMVLMHGYSTPTGYSAVRTQAQRLRDEGFFVISVSMRGRDASDGVRDSGGVEIYDIYDAVEAVKKAYSSYTNTSSVSITGVSGGGGNVMSALTKFPDYFRVGASYFGMSDYGYDLTTGWYNNGANSGSKRTTELDRDIGNPNTGGSTVTDRYMARASNLASKNNPYSEIHLFVNANEPICPIVNDTSYKDNAVAAASYAGEFNNITVHTGEAGTYYDFDGDGVNDSNEQQYWPHGAPTADQQASSEAWYINRLLNGEIAQPVLNSSDDLYVAGFVKTTPFEFWLGDGQNAAGDLTYSLSSTAKTFHLEVLSSNLSIASLLKVDTEDMDGKEVQVLLDGELVDTFVGGGVYQYSGLLDGSTVTFSAVPEPGTIALLLAGGAALAVWTVRRRR